jgi:hypothetical protein
MMIVEETMNKILRQTLFWLPRGMGIVFVLFLSIFALDIFDTGLNFWETILGLFVLAIAVAASWRHEWVGAAVFMGWTVFYVTVMRGFDWIAYALIAGIPFGVGVLFLAGWVWRDKVHA